jgi:hypothetical protein
VTALAVVDWGELGEVVWTSAVAGLGVTLCFSLAILGATRFADARRGDGGGPKAFAWALLGTLGFAATMAAVVGALIVMTSKG